MNSPRPAIRYSQCWEDADLLLKLLQINTEDVVVSVVSGGCNTFSIASHLPHCVYALDSNPAQIFLAQLKWDAVQQLNRSEYLKFVGVQEDAYRWKYFRALCQHTKYDYNEFFHANKSFITDGIINCGQFDRYLGYFRTYILPLLQNERTLDLVLDADDRAEQENIFSNKWNNWRWNTAVRIFFGRFLMQWLGRGKEMFQYNQSQSVGQIIMNRIQIGLTQRPTKNNPYLSFMLKGRYGERLPHYMRSGNYDTLAGYSGMQFRSINIVAFLKAMPDASISKYNLSDIFEPMSSQECSEAMIEILRTAKNGARVVFWNNFVPRNIPDQLKPYFVQDSRAEAWREKEQVFFYEKFFVFEIKK